VRTQGPYGSWPELLAWPTVVPGRFSRFTRAAWVFCGYLLLVILFGAWVRITHSGAGCGSHWPTCNGEIIPASPSWETIVEFTHRLTSGLLGILGLMLVGWAMVARKPRRVVIASVVALVFIIAEALIGAGIVLKELVADDASEARAIVISLHLVNTLALTGAASLVAWWSHDERPVLWSNAPRAAARLVLVLGALVLTASTGAVTALGDTLFPVVPAADAGLFAHVRDDLSSTNHFLVRLRIVHPMIAVTAVAIILLITGWLREQSGLDSTTQRLGAVLRAGAIVEAVIGLLNVGLAAPGSLQLLHLLVAQGVWIAAVLALVAVMATQSRQP